MAFQLGIMSNSAQWDIRGITGTYHHISVKHLGRYAGEFAGHHNDRPMDTVEQMKAMAYGMASRRLRYEDLIS